MSNVYSLSGSKEEMLAQFDELIKRGLVGDNPKGREYSCHNKMKREDTVDGNPTAAWKMAHPYTGTVEISGKIGLNGKVGAIGQNGAFGD